MLRLCVVMLTAFACASVAWGQSAEPKFALTDARGCQIFLPLESSLLRARLGKMSESTRCIDRKIEGAAVFGMEMVSLQSGVEWTAQYVQARFFKDGIPAELHVGFGNMPNNRSEWWVNVGGRGYVPKDSATADQIMARIKSAASSAAEAEFLISVTRLSLENPARFYAEYARDWNTFFVNRTLPVDDPKVRGRSARGG